MINLISAIIMASGFSRRMGKNKLLMKYNDKFLIEYTLDTISKFDFKEKIIVTQYEKIKETIPNYSELIGYDMSLLEKIYE